MTDVDPADKLRSTIKMARSLNLTTVGISVQTLVEIEQLLHRPLVSETVQQLVDEMQVQGIPIYRARWAPDGCTCPWPWPSTDGAHVLELCPHFRVPRATDNHGSDR